MNPAAPPILCRHILALCRPGFEAECAAELLRRTQREGLAASCAAAPSSGWVRVDLSTLHQFDHLDRVIRLSHLTFSRQLSFAFARVCELPSQDRAGPLAERASDARAPFSALLMEAADSDAGRPLAAFARRLRAPLERRLDKANLLRPKRTHLPRLHVFFEDGATALLSVSHAGNASPWEMGIPRLRMPADAPSRSTLKLAEALVDLVDATELAQCLRPGQRAVDLGAAPGGWSWQLANRGLHVTAVDNGPIARSVLATGLVTHVRADGFSWRPPRPVDWMVCDMVEQPARIAALAADWVAAGRCRQTIFNLKLPMKRRLEEIDRCIEIVTRRFARSGEGFELRLRQLYHDREEITAFLRSDPDH